MFLNIKLCDNAATAETILIIKNVLTLIHFFIPVILIIMSMIQIIKVITSDKVDNQKLVASLAKKLISAAIVFLIPTIINLTMSLAEGINLTADDCWSKATRQYVNDLQKKETKENNSTEKDRIGKLANILGSMISNSSISSNNTTNHADDFIIKDDFVVLAHVNSKKYSTHTIKITDKKNKKMSASDFTFKSENPAIATVSSNGKIKAKFGGTTYVNVTYKKDTNQNLKVKVTVVHSLYTKVKTKEKLTVKDIKTGAKKTLPKGTKGVYNGLGTSGNLHRHYLAGNTLKVGHNYYKVNVSDVNYYDYKINKKIDKETAEKFVNSHGFKSKTKYLFWSNQGTQYEYVFTGSKKKWKLYKVFRISTGDALGINREFGNTHGNSGTGIYPTYYVMGTFVTSSYSGIYFPGGYIPKNNGSSGYHANGGTRKPKTRGCTAFKSNDLKWFTSNIKKIGGSQIITI